MKRGRGADEERILVADVNLEFFFLFFHFPLFLGEKSDLIVWIVYEEKTSWEFFLSHLVFIWPA